MNILTRALNGEGRRRREVLRDVPEVRRAWSELSPLPDEQFHAHVKRERSGGGSDDPLAAAATACEAVRRALGLTLHDNQIAGMLALSGRTVVELPTGEGKTVMAACSLYLAALRGEKVHVITANGYLARRDAGWMRPVYDMLGMSCSAIDETSDTDSVHKAACADVLYAPAAVLAIWSLRNEVGVDREGTVEIAADVALVDEADTVLLDQATRPVGLSVTDDMRQNSIREAWQLASKLVQNDADGEGGEFGVDERDGAVALTEAGWDRVERETGKRLYESDLGGEAADLRDALVARALLEKGRDYIVDGDMIRPIDRTTGRPGGGRFSAGIHAAVELKEGVPPTPVTRTVARITLQHYFARYERLCGMTASAAGAEDELQEMYQLDVLTLPANRPVIRVDHPDVIYPTRQQKFDALAEDAVARHARRQPVLIGVDTTGDVDDVSGRLSSADVPHTILSAANHAEEAEILARAGHSGAVTIATRIAGRGVDIVLGSSDDDAELVRSLGGLCILAAQRFDTLRADRQLRGRAGRQGDPGESRYFLSLEDELVRVYSGPVAARAVATLSDAGGRASGHASLTRLVDKAQEQRTAQMHTRRKGLLAYDTELHRQRQILLAVRERARDGRDLTLLTLIDRLWADHLEEADMLRRAVGLRRIGKLDPQTEYRRELDEAFRTLLGTVEESSGERLPAVRK